MAPQLKSLFPKANYGYLFGHGNFAALALKDCAGRWKVGNRKYVLDPGSRASNII